MTWDKLTYPRLIMSMVLSGHIVTALVMLFSKEGGIALGKKMYNAEFEASDALAYLLRPAGAYVLGFGLLQGMAIREPLRYKGVYDATLALFLIRQAQRLLLRDEIVGAFQMTRTRHWRLTLWYQFVFALLLLGRIQLEQADE